MGAGACRERGAGVSAALPMQVRAAFRGGVFGSRRTVERFRVRSGTVGVLSIGKLGAGQQSYYLENVSNGVEDYYSGRGEAPGRWVGTAARVLGLDGRVNGDDLRAVLEGRDPGTGVPLGRVRSDRVPGFDLTFRAPKSVSVLFGLGGFEVSADVHGAHEAAVDAALGYLEREACWSRRGTNGTEGIAGEGFVGAAFRHRSSRAGDPHLHTHVLVANTTLAADGRWATLDARHIYLHAKTAGYLYEAHLRAELTRRLGVAWRPVVNGIADLEGIPDAVLRAFSTRRAEIEAEMATRGVSSPRAAEIAALDTRQAKDYTVDPVTMTERWWQRASDVDVDRDTIAATMHRAEPTPLTENEKRRLLGELLGPAGLTERASSFDRRAVLRAWCEQLRAGSRHQRHRGARGSDPRRAGGRCSGGERADQSPDSIWGATDRRTRPRRPLLDGRIARARTTARRPRDRPARRRRRGGRRRHRARRARSPTRDLRRTSRDGRPADHQRPRCRRGHRARGHGQDVRARRRAGRVATPRPPRRRRRARGPSRRRASGDRRYPLRHDRVAAR